MTVRYRLSPQQQRIWSLQQRDGQTPYRAESMVDIYGSVDSGLMATAVSETMRQHEMLRTTFSVVDGRENPFQVVHSEIPPDFRVQDLSQTPVDPGVHQFAIDASDATRFDLENGPLWRVRLVKLRPQRYHLTLKLPALCADAATLDTLVAEIFQRYRIHSEGNGSIMRDIAQYANIAEWQKDLLHGEDTANERSYWQSHPAQRFPAASLPYALAAQAAFVPCCRPLTLDPEILAAVRRSAHKFDTDLEAILLGAWIGVIRKLTGRSRQIIGVASDGRAYPELQEVVGLLARHLPLSVELSDGIDFAHLIHAVRDARSEGLALQEFFDPGKRHQGTANSDLPYAPERLPIAFEYQAADPNGRFGDSRFVVRERRSWYERFQLKVAWCSSGKGLAGQIYYDDARISATAVRRLSAQYMELLKAACVSPESTIDDLSMVDSAERRKLVLDFNARRREIPNNVLVHDLIHQQAARNPTRSAVASEDCTLSFAELDRLSDRCAAWLLAYGAAPDELVAILLEPSVAMIVAMLGVLKSGQAYLPLDPVLPPTRLARILRDAGTQVVLTNDALHRRLSIPGMETLIYETIMATEAPSASQPQHHTDPEHLAYVVYTSGSTGVPKGVGVSHRSLLNYILSVREALALEDGMSFAAPTTFGADLANTAIFSALGGGGCLHVFGSEIATDPKRFSDLIERFGTDCLKIVPSLLKALLQAAEDPARILPRQRLVLGGEPFDALLIEQIQQLAPECVIFNHYGPTEATVGVATRRFRTGESVFPGVRPPLGRPLANACLLVLDDHMQPVPTGAAGELYIGGLPLARGYINRPGETAACFLPDPFSNEQGERLYRTGDRVRMLPDSELQFIGRSDEQVKIHGVRIEPGEVELALAEHESVAECRVIQDDNYNSLLAYIVPARGSDISSPELRRHLRRFLAEMMIPGYFISLDTLPLTPNGKLDRTALPAPETASPQPRLRREPRNSVERTLALIWAEVLNVDRVGVHDNFFELGGDSILSIIIVARTSRAGIKITPRQLFQNPTVASLAAVAGKVDVRPTHKPSATIEVPLTPIQHWFFKKSSPQPNYYNQGVAIALQRAIRPDHLEQALTTLIANHEALRLSFRFKNGNWQQCVVPHRRTVVVPWLNLAALSAEQLERTSAYVCNELHAGLDLESGPLIRTAVIDQGAQRGLLLIVVVHHLAVDGLSWRILLEDLELASLQCAKGESITLTPTPTAFKDWAMALQRRAQSAEVKREKDYWRAQVCRASDRLSPDTGREDVPNDVAHADVVSVTLDEKLAHSLVHRVPALYDASVQEIVLAAVLACLARWTGNGSVVIEMESHGRQQIEESIDITRMVGWLTARYPLRCEIDPAADPGAWVEAVKHALRRVPVGGLGWGCLTYLQGEALDRQLVSSPAPDFSFNYFGRLDQENRSTSSFGRIKEAPGMPRHPQTPRSNLVEINAQLTDAGLHVSWTYGMAAYSRSTIEAKAAEFLRNLHSLVKDPVQEWIEGDNVQDVYGLSPMQQGMLFDCLLSPERRVYFNQSLLTVNGRFEIETFRAAWQQVMTRHTMLRTIFLWEGLAHPVQVVCEHVEMPFFYSDQRSLEPDRPERSLDELLRIDRRKKFRLEEPPLMRLHVVRTGDDTYQILWSRHHMLLDGWSAAIVLKEVFTFYELLLRGEATPQRGNELLGVPAPYGSYIRWLQRHDRKRAKDYWCHALQGLHHSTLIGSDGVRKDGPIPGERYQCEANLHLSSDLTSAVGELLRREGLTVSSLAQGLWALVLSHFCGQTDVVFGLTISGRSSDLPEIDTMVGLMINTLPLRLCIPADGPILRWVGRLQQERIRMEEYYYSSLSEIKAWAEIPGDQQLFNTIVVSGNYPIEDDRRMDLTGINIGETKSFVENSIPLTLRVVPGTPIFLQFLYEPGGFSAEFVRALLEHLEALCQALVAQPDITPRRLIDTLACRDARHVSTREQHAKELGKHRLQQIRHR